MASTNPYAAPATDPKAAASEGDSFTHCPRCSASMESEFTITAVGFISLPRMRWPLQLVESLDKRSWWEKVTSVLMHYFRTHLCRSCGVYIVDTDRTISYWEAKRIARAN